MSFEILNFICFIWSLLKYGYVFLVGKYTRISLRHSEENDLMNMKTCCLFKRNKPAFAAIHGPHSLVQIGPGCVDRA